MDIHEATQKHLDEVEMPWEVFTRNEVHRHQHSVSYWKTSKQMGFSQASDAASESIDDMQVSVDLKRMTDYERYRHATLYIMEAILEGDSTYGVEADVYYSFFGTPVYVDREKFGAEFVREGGGHAFEILNPAHLTANPEIVYF